ncbi:MAG: S8 family serine peptidase [Burkholderiales bacterium]
MYTVIDDAVSAETVSIDVTSDVAPRSPQNPAAAQFFGAQWHMRSISANAAWAGGKLGKATTRVGILDTGIGYTHVDLNGVVDLAASRSFLSEVENKRVTDTFGATTNLVADLHFHGTHVASIIASNGIGTAGVTSGVRLVGLKVCSPGQPDADPAKAWLPSCSSSAVFGALLYAADMGLDVVNLSLGAEFLRRRAAVVRDERGPNGPSFISIINRVFNYVNQKGTAVVVAAGNSGRNMDHDGNLYNVYCNAPHVICVSALGPTAAPSAFGPFTNVDALAGYSNFGSSAITVAAPGGTGNNLPPTNPNSNQGWVWSSCSRHSLAIPACQTVNRVIGLTGTSMASPHAAGVAALIAGEIGHDANAIREVIVGSADDLGKPGTDPAYGGGRINAARAVGLP